MSAASQETRKIDKRNDGRLVDPIKEGKIKRKSYWHIKKITGKEDYRVDEKAGWGHFLFIFEIKMNEKV